MLVLFEDLIFESKSLGGIGATHTFKNGVTISVQASKGNYSKPREDLKSPNDFCSFEIAVWNKDGEWVTKNFVPNNNDDVAGWQDRSQINALMLSLQCAEMWEYLQTKGKTEKCEIENKDFTKNLEMAEVEGDGWSFEVWVDPNSGVHYNVPIEIVRDWSNIEER